MKDTRSFTRYTLDSENPWHAAGSFSLCAAHINAMLPVDSACAARIAFRGHVRSRRWGADSGPGFYLDGGHQGRRHRELAAECGKGRRQPVRHAGARRQTRSCVPDALPVLLVEVLSSRHPARMAGFSLPPVRHVPLALRSVRRKILSTSTLLGTRPDRPQVHVLATIPPWRI